MKLTIDSIDQPSGSFRFETARPEPIYTDSIVPHDIAVSAEMTMTVDSDTYARMAQFVAAPAVTVVMEHSGGESDPFYEHPVGWRAVLRQMARIVSYEVRKAASRVELPWRSVVTIPNLIYREDTPA